MQMKPKEAWGCLSVLKRFGASRLETQQHSDIWWFAKLIAVQRCDVARCALWTVGVFHFIVKIFVTFRMSRNVVMAD